MAEIESEEEMRLRNIAARVHKKLNKIENAKWKARHDKLIGKYFKYRNSFGHGKSWWLYGKVLPGGHSSYYTNLFTFQTTSKNTIEIEMRNPTSNVDPGNGWIEIDKRVFNQAWRRVLKRVNRSRP